MAMSTISTPVPVSPEALTIITYKQQPVIISRTLADLYGVEQWQVRQNYKNNWRRFEEGKHYFKLQGAELQEFKNRVDKIYPVRQASVLMLWTERGAARHAKMLRTDQAWAIFEKLEDHYFKPRAPQQLPLPAVSGTVTLTMTENTAALLYVSLIQPLDFDGHFHRWRAAFERSDPALAGQVGEVRAHLQFINRAVLRQLGDTLLPYYQGRARETPLPPPEAAWPLDCLPPAAYDKLNTEGRRAFQNSIRQPVWSAFVKAMQY